ncbi:MAG: universal stress protein [Deltaproteobacteria bacterium]|nr:universal stress protein [Deltaproteobacteria bacterium]
MVSKIFVPVDGSKVSQKAAKFAVYLAKQTGASLTLLSVNDTRFFVEQTVPASVSPTHVTESIEDFLKQAAQFGTDAIAKLCERNRIPYSVTVRTGHPVEEIVNEAAKSKADLIVMGSHGKSALKAAVLGSVTYGVMHKNSKIPVLIVRR